MANIVCVIPIYSSLLHTILSRYEASGGPPMPKRPAVMPEAGVAAAAVGLTAGNSSFLPPQKKSGVSSTRNTSQNRISTVLSPYLPERYRPRVVQPSIFSANRLANVSEDRNSASQVQPPSAIGFSPFVNSSLNLILKPTPESAIVTKNL